MRLGVSDTPEVVDFYQIVFDATLSDPNLPHGREGYYFAENGEYKLYDLAKAYSQALYDVGKGKSPDPTSFTADEVQKYFGVITSLHVGLRYN
jgi:predicted enzyme related to lactoylglutathione lyase